MNKMNENEHFMFAMLNKHEEHYIETFEICKKLDATDGIDCIKLIVLAMIMFKDESQICIDKVLKNCDTKVK